jgi:hypothetical protein
MILEQVQQILSGGKGLAIPEIVERILDLCGREDANEILRLLLRLDRRFEQNGELWFCKVKDSNPATRIIAATKEYFKNGPRAELLVHVVRAVAKATGESNQDVQEVIVDTFQIIQGGKVVLNKMREREYG